MNKITRTITETVCNVIMLDESKNTFEGVVTVAGTYKTPERLKKAVEKECEGENTIPLYIKEYTIQEARYEMPLDTFIRHATRVDD